MTPKRRVLHYFTSTATGLAIIAFAGIALADTEELYSIHFASGSTVKYAANGIDWITISLDSTTCGGITTAVEGDGALTEDSGCIFPDAVSTIAGVSTGLTLISDGTSGSYTGDDQSGTLSYPMQVRLYLRAQDGSYRCMSSPINLSSMSGTHEMSGGAFVGTLDSGTLTSAVSFGITAQCSSVKATALAAAFAHIKFHFDDDVGHW